METRCATAERELHSTRAALAAAEQQLTAKLTQEASLKERLSQSEHEKGELRRTNQRTARDLQLYADKL
ncbi:hypothetical protein FHG87_025799, partial [Trinorchestia longiramus]